MRPGTSTRWAGLWKRLGARGEPAPVFRDLELRYAEPRRAYHTLQHIEECLDEFEAACGLARDERAVEMALWYHDAVYDPGEHDNEERSAALARQIARDADLPSEFVRSTGDLILATRHDVISSDPDAQLLTDIDLAILGQSEDRFREYEKQIRQEYRWVPGPMYRTKRSAVLRHFLSRPAIYSTPYFRNRYETRARENLVRSLDEGGH